MLNRGAIAISPKQAFKNWLMTLDVCDLTLPSSDEKQLYLVPYFEDDEDAASVLGQVYERIFRRELSRWYTVQESWPQDRSFAVFNQWFNVEYLNLIDDLGDGPIEDE